MSERINFNKFSFTELKSRLNRILYSAKPKIIDDFDDFWRFLEKYEAVKRRADVKKERTLNELGINPCVSTKDKTFGYLQRCFTEERSCKKNVDLYLNKFVDILSTYRNFKKNERVNKLKKLKETRQALPVFRFKDTIIEAVKNERVVIIAGDTGCGKSTQVPQYLLDGGFTKIACTQPRRLACISLSKRVTYELQSETKRDVAYKIRFETNVGEDTRILFLTEGLLLRQIASKELDLPYDVIILDEVHERHLFSDFLLGVLKCVLTQKPDLKIVLMSATINTELFLNYFQSENARLIEVPGRLYPIELIYRPRRLVEKDERFDCQPYLQIMQIIDTKFSKTEKGDLLVFLSGSLEIQTLADAAKEYNLITKTWIILPLHSSLSLDQQDKVFDYPPDGVRKCIIATNIAETSLTIDGIRFVVDSGKVKEMSYDCATKMRKLKEFNISKASAEQRKGRAGRTGPGVCYRIYSEDNFNAFEAYTSAEIHKVPIDSVLLQMIAMGLPDVRQFPFLEPPAPESIQHCITSLKNAGAIDDTEVITAMGHALAQLPVDVSIGKMLIMAMIFNQIDAVFSTTAALNVQNPLTDKAYRDLDAQEARKSLESDHGDVITLINIYSEWLQIKDRGENSKKWCRRRGIEEQRLYEITKLRMQLKTMFERTLLLDVEVDEAGTSSERSMRNSDLSRLRRLKREHERDGQVRKRLKLDVFDVHKDDDDDDDAIDIKDVEFRLRTDSKKLRKIVEGTELRDGSDLIMLKLIVTSGLYPQIAVADEYNYCKSLSEQLFHTRTKSFVSLHPVSYYANHADVLQLTESDIDVPPDGYFSKKPLSSAHQVICYLTLLETTKVYVTNMMRMPAIQTSFLFAQTIETNATLTRVMCDEWILYELPFGDSGQTLLLKACQLRKKWANLLDRQLKLKENAGKSDDCDDGKSMRVTQEELEIDLIKYIKSDVSYTMHRLLPADLKNIYTTTYTQTTPFDPNPFDSDYESKPCSKGGVQVTPFLTYNCVTETEWSFNNFCIMSEQPWMCSHCEKEFYLSTIEKLQHKYVLCEAGKSKTNQKEDSLRKKRPNTKGYECAVCNKTLYLTPIEILKHKKSH